MPAMLPGDITTPLRRLKEIADRSDKIDRERVYGRATVEHYGALTAALDTLAMLGYTYHGGTLWKPPMGLRRDDVFVTPALAADPVALRAFVAAHERDGVPVGRVCILCCPRRAPSPAAPHTCNACGHRTFAAVPRP